MKYSIVFIALSLCVACAPPKPTVRYEYFQQCDTTGHCDTLFHWEYPIEKTKP